MHYGEVSVSEVMLIFYSSFSVLSPEVEETAGGKHCFSNKDTSFEIVTLLGRHMGCCDWSVFLCAAELSTVVLRRGSFVMDMLAEPTCFAEVNKSFVAVIYYQDRDRLPVSLSLIAVAMLVWKTFSSAFLQALVYFPPLHSFSKLCCPFSISLSNRGQTECLGMCAHIR